MLVYSIFCESVACLTNSRLSNRLSLVVSPKALSSTTVVSPFFTEKYSCPFWSSSAPTAILPSGEATLHVGSPSFEGRFSSPGPHAAKSETDKTDAIAIAINFLFRIPFLRQITFPMLSAIDRTVCLRISSLARSATVSCFNALTYA